MRTKKNIAEKARQRIALAAAAQQRGVILQPGAIGDCIFTLPLAQFMKRSLGLAAVDMIGHTDYIGVMPGRTCIDAVSSIDSIPLHRLFVNADTFDIADNDPLITTFADYSWIASFLGEPNSDFEKNLIFTVNCSHGAEIITLPLKPPADCLHHVTGFYISQFIDQCGPALEAFSAQPYPPLVKPTAGDIEAGKRGAAELGIRPGRKIIIIHPGASGSWKCWHLDNFLAVARRLVETGCEVLFVLGPVEIERLTPRQIDSMERTTACAVNLDLSHVLALLTQANAFLGNDTGITHLAAAMGLKTIAVFGPTNPVVYRPLGQSVTVLVGEKTGFADKPSAALQKEALDLLLT